MKANDITLSAAEIGEVLDITARRVRQLAEDGIFVRTSRGQYRLVDCVRAYLAMAESRGDSDELRREKIRLIRAQARRAELDNSVREGAKASLDFQDAVLNALSTRLFLRLRAVADWTYHELNERTDGDTAHSVAGAVQQWIVGARYEIEQELKSAIERSRQRGFTIRDYDDLMRLIKGTPQEEDEEVE